MRICFAVWEGGRISSCCLGGVRVYVFAVWAGGVLLFLFGRGTGVHSLTGLPGSALKENNKKYQTAKTHGFRRSRAPWSKTLSTSYIPRKPP